MRLNLAALEAEAHAQDEEREPFELDLGDHAVVLPHPEDMTVGQLEEFFTAEMNGNPFGALRALVGEGDTYDLFARSCTGPGLNLLLEKWREHYGLPSPGEASASHRSSTGSGTRSRPTSRTGTRRTA